MSVTRQPGMGGNFNFSGEFSNGLCDCCADCGTCVFAYFCMPCYLCKLFSDAGECLCTPFFCPQSIPYMRTKIRTAYKIEGAMWKDVCTFAFCPFCTVIQMGNELKNQGDAN